jgi:hypothetical protein
MQVTDRDKSESLSAQLIAAATGGAKILFLFPKADEDRYHYLEQTSYNYLGVVL